MNLPINLSEPNPEPRQIEEIPQKHEASELFAPNKNGMVGSAAISPTGARRAYFQWQNVSLKKGIYTVY